MVPLSYDTVASGKFLLAGASDNENREIRNEESRNKSGEKVL